MPAELMRTGTPSPSSAAPGTSRQPSCSSGVKMRAKDYTDPKVQEAVTDEAMFKATKDGFKDKDGKVLMKPSEGLTDAEIKDLVAYMRKFKK
jgi:cytochrome c1